MSTPHPEHDPRWISSIARRLRLVQLLDAAEAAGLTPIKLLRLHAFAFLANLLSPVWELWPQDGKILKRRGGPFYPELQRDLDRLVGMGVASIENLDYKKDEQKRWRLEGSYALLYDRADPILEAAYKFEDEHEMHVFLRELAFALAALSEDEFDQAMVEDATYADPRAIAGQVIDFAEWRSANYTANAANYFDHVMPLNLKTSPGEKIHLYVRYLERRTHARG